MDHNPASATQPAVAHMTPATWTTRRGLATASFCLGLWGSLVFWWIPFGLAISSVGSTLAVLSIFMGWRAGKDGEHLAWLGLLFGGSGASMAVASYWFMQTAFEGTWPRFPPLF